MNESRAPDPAQIVGSVLAWFAIARRPLPWRAPGTTPWGVLVSEFMCQQTQVDRVIPRWTAWLIRWPSPQAQAASDVADAVRLWDRLGYPRRAKWLHESAVIIRDRHDGAVPSATEELRALPGVGEYTAAAVRAFAFGLPSIVLDTNVRRVLVRVVHGRAQPPPHITVAERAEAATFIDHPHAAEWSAAVMELGALICTATRPLCGECPVADHCAWLAAGFPKNATSGRRQQPFAGSDRQVRGRVLALLRESIEPVPASALEALWDDSEQRQRALSSLLVDGLVDESPVGDFSLKGTRSAEGAKH